MRAQQGDGAARSWPRAGAPRAAGGAFPAAAGRAVTDTEAQGNTSLIFVGSF